MGKKPHGLKKLVDYHLFKSAVNRYLHRHAGGDARPVFHDIDATCPELDGLTRHAELIRAEFDAIAELDRDLPRYHDVDPGEVEISGGGDPARRWNVLMLYLLGHRIESNCARCPGTARLLEKIPNLVQAFISILDPRKSVPPHEGPYLGYLRYHLALRVPRIDPPRLVVGGLDYVWREGEAVLFDDSFEHQVINESDGLRAVLIVDILRPLPRMADAVNRFVTGVIARNTYGRSVVRRVEAAAAGR